MSDVVGVEMKLEPLLQLLGVVVDVIVRDPLEAVPAQGAGHGVDIRAPDLMRQDRLARLDQLVARRDHHDHRLAADPHAGHARRGGDGHLRRGQPRAGGEQQRPLARVGAAAMDVLPRLDFDAFGELDLATRGW